MRRTKDFTLQKYIDLCKAILSSRYQPITVHDYILLQDHLSPFVIIRHDVDLKVRPALTMAKHEADLGIRATYYFRYPKTFDPDSIKSIQAMGHEVGYHYETLSKTRGNFDHAISQFNNELKAFRTICKITTICMHGSPLSKYDNRDIWLNYNFRDYQIIGEAYLSFINTDLRYFTDTGRSWAGNNSLRDSIPGAKLSPPIKSTTDLISLIRSRRQTGIYINTHPNRWATNNVDWIEGYFRDTVFNVGKKILKAVRK